MRLNYRRLGDYIELVNCLNADLRYGESDVRGVSNSKEIIQTRANNEGREFNKFYVVKTHDFIYNSRTSRMGEKVGLGYNDSENTFITSFNNTVFRVKNDALLPMYLFMWFNRQEFDRYVRYHSWGSSTEIFSWEEMCNTLLPIPDIDKQREIIKEYNVIQNRIALYQQLIQRLEETAQTIYKQWFVDFEFPDENGKPYKSSGGKMTESELGKIPKGWELQPLIKIASYVNRGFTPSYVEGEGIIVLNQKCVRDNSIDFSFARKHNSKVKRIDPDRYLQQFDILVNSTGEGTLGRVGLIKEKHSQLIVDTHITIVRTSNIMMPLCLWFSLSTRTDEIEKLAEGSTGQTELGRTNLGALRIVVPLDKVQKQFEKIVTSIIALSSKTENELPVLISLKNLLLSKLATIEN